MSGGSDINRLEAVRLDLLSRVAADPIKRAADVLCATALLLFIAPLLLLAAVLIKLESSGPALFRQQRGGLNGRPFTIYKLRSMRCQENGDEIAHAQRADGRVTRIGALLRMSSIDELPQLFNVLRGDMSLVGPRPHALAHDHYYSARIAGYGRRFRARPGLTGLAQIQGYRGGVDGLDDMANRVAADNAYIDSWSLGSDLRIVLRTVPQLLIATNAY
ncbi:MAG: exopolysaccharide biosynthesis protein [Caulobacter sp.]|nr:exopolysaccharide biosynthesis protein [Caulobacter sp.]